MSETATPQQTATRFDIESSEGLPIRGDLLVPAKARSLVVVAHGFKGFKDWGFFPWLGEQLCSRGSAVCRFNMSRSGIGEDPENFDRLDLFEHDTYSQQVRDLAAAVRYAQQQTGPLPLFLLGHSRGGGVALLTASLLGDVEGVITWSAISRVDRWDDETKRTWRERGFMDQVNSRTNQVMRMSPAILDDYDAHRAELDICDAARRLTAPLLIVHGAKDESVPVAEAHEISRCAPDASISIIEHASHTYNAIHPLVHVSHELSMAMMVSAAFIRAYA